MKEKKSSILIAMLYLLVLFFGLFMMFFIPAAKHYHQLENITKRCIDTFLRGEENPYITNFGMQYLIFDSNGNCISNPEYHTPNIYDFSTFQNTIPQKFPDGFNLSYKLLAKKDFSSETYSSHSLCLIASSNFYLENSSECVIYLIRPFTDLPHNLMTYIIAWALLFFMHNIYHYLYLQKKMALEERERMYLVGMNHELKSPITSIKALTEVLLDGMVTDPKKVHFYYQTILSEANTLETTVHAILDYAKLQSKTKTYPKKAYRPETLFQTTLTRYKLLEEEMNFQLYAPDWNDTSYPLVFTNQELVSHLLDILLQNATKFISDYGEIRIKIQQEKDYLLVSIQDNGCGISKEHLPHVFEKFYQVEPSHTQKGSGLGLALAKEITEKLNETITISSEVNVGTTISFTLHTTSI